MTTRPLILVVALALTGCFPVRRSKLTSVAPEIRPPISYFLDQSYVSRPAKPPRLLYEGQPSANIVLSQSLERAGTNVRHDTLGAWYPAHAIIVTPKFVIRQMGDSSAAVPPPSFMPKLTLQGFLIRKEIRPRGPTINEPVEFERFNLNPRNWIRAHLVMGEFIFGHHSNGQAGCFYANQVLVLRDGSQNDYDCLWSNADSSDRAINYSLGSFSTWFMRFGLGYVLMWGLSSDSASTPPHRLGALASFQYHVPAMTEDPQKPLYGDQRFRIEAEYSHRFNAQSSVRLLGPVNARLAVTGDWALNAGPGIPNAQRSIELAATLERMYGFGAFVRRYSGQDYYNINFTKSLHVTQVGVTIRYERPHAFAR